MLESLVPLRFLRRRGLLCAGLAVALLGISAARAHDDDRGKGKQKCVTSWAASAHGLYPSGTAVAQPNLAFAFPAGTTSANDQTFRLIVRPNLWGERVRIRFSNFFGPQAVTLDGIYIGLQASAGAVVPGTNQRVTFGRGVSVTLPPGQSVWSDAVDL